MNFNLFYVLFNSKILFNIMLMMDAEDDDCDVFKEGEYP